MSQKEYFTTKKAAEILNLTDKKIYKLIYSGKIRARKLENRWRISAEELNKYLYRYDPVLENLYEFEKWAKDLLSENISGSQKIDITDKIPEKIISPDFSIKYGQYFLGKLLDILVRKIFEERAKRKEFEDKLLIIGTEKKAEKKEKVKLGDIKKIIWDWPMPGFKKSFQAILLFKEEEKNLYIITKGEYNNLISLGFEPSLLYTDSLDFQIRNEICSYSFSKTEHFPVDITKLNKPINRQCGTLDRNFS